MPCRCGHPAESRVRKLSAEIPARFIAFDVLVWKGETVVKSRSRSADRVGRVANASSSPAMRDRAEAAFEWSPLRGDRPRRGRRQAARPRGPWLARRRRQGEAREDGGLRRRRVRWKEKPTRLATLLLGLYDKDELHYVGSCAVAASRHDMTLESSSSRC